MPATKKKAQPTAAKKATRDIISRAKTIGKVTDKLWAAAAKTPMFSKASERKGPDGKVRTMRRSARLIGAMSYNIACAGAAEAVKREQQIECGALGLAYESSSNSVSSPGLTPGAKYMLEQFLCAYVQESMHAAHKAKKSLKKFKRFNEDTVRLAFEHKNQEIFGAAMVVPRAVVVVPLPKKGQKKNAKAKEPEAGAAAEEEAEDEAAAEAEAAEEEEE